FIRTPTIVRPSAVTAVTVSYFSVTESPNTRFSVNLRAGSRIDSTTYRRERAEPTVDSSGPRRPPRPLLMWHDPQRAAPKNSASPRSGLPIAAAGGCCRDLRYETIRQISSVVKWLAGIAVPGTP